MCGIFAIFLRRPLTDADIALGRTGTQSLLHRGPDNGGEWIDRSAGVFLGHRRLSIIDLSPASNQPMTRENLTVSYNGEIYNYRELRRQLEDKSPPFVTAGDTEVLLAAWGQEGSGTLDRIDGMFAFALWDGSAGWLAVDRFGEKQLYFAQTNDGVYVSSEPAPLIRLLRLNADLSQQNVTAFLCLGYLRAPQTFYPALRKIPPAHFLRIDQGTPGQLSRFWRPPYGVAGRGKPVPLSERELDRVQAALIASVERRLEADVEPCVFLSAGVDSSLVASMLSRDLGRKARCITVSFPQGATRDESEDAARIAAALDLDHETIVNRDDPEAANCDYYLGLFAQPNDCLTTASIEQMTRRAAERGFRLGLTGFGGDEIFYGYLKHRLFYNRRRYFGMPARLRQTIGMALSPFGHINSTARAFIDLCSVSDAERMLAVKNLPAYSVLRTVPGVKDWAQQAFLPASLPIELAAPRVDLEDTMPNSQLASLDLGSMRSSFELRTPFLSADLMNVVAEFDPRALLAFGQKSVLRRLLGRYLPRELWDRKKHGFSFPADRFLQHYQTPPTVPHVPTEVVRTVWARVREARGWRRLAVRMVIAARFSVSADA